jgi:hypothetical protein
MISLFQFVFTRCWTWIVTIVPFDKSYKASSYARYLNAFIREISDRIFSRNLNRGRALIFPTFLRQQLALFGPFSLLMFA